jgi:hypothetical protein
VSTASGNHAITTTTRCRRHVPPHHGAGAADTIVGLDFEAQSLFTVAESPNGHNMQTMQFDASSGAIVGHGLLLGDDGTYTRTLVVLDTQPHAFKVLGTVPGWLVEAGCRVHSVRRGPLLDAAEQRRSRDDRLSPAVPQR